MNEIKTICPLTKNSFMNDCVSCRLVVKQNDKIIGCSIKHIARNIHNNQNIANIINIQFTEFKKDIDCAIKNTQDIILKHGH